MKIAGVVLIVLGFVGLCFPGIPYKSTENIAEIGDLKMKVTENKHFAIPPLVSGVFILAGAAMTFGTWRRPAD